MARLALFAWMWWQLPPALYRHVGGDARVKAIIDTRTALLAGLVGLGAIGTFWLNSRVYKITARTFELTEQGHITERYTKAIEQLGNKDSLDVRLGGIYALERIAVDSIRDHPTVVEVLSAFVREHSRPTTSRMLLPIERSRMQTAEHPPARVRQDHAATPRPATDMQAAISVLGRLPVRPDVPRANLFGTNLTGADLRKATLTEIEPGRREGSLPPTSVRRVDVTRRSGTATRSQTAAGGLTLRPGWGRGLMGCGLRPAALEARGGSWWPRLTAAPTRTWPGHLLRSEMS